MVAGQPQTTEMNFIIMVNGKLHEGILSNVHLLIKDEGKIEKIEAIYIPGSLSFDADNITNVDSVFIVFNHSIFCNDEHILVNYEIPFLPLWLEYSYLILRVYDLGHGEYKNVFKPLSRDKNYNYELDYPGGSIKRIMINKVQKKLKCD